MTCPHCSNDNAKLIEDITSPKLDPKHPTRRVFLCYVCDKTFKLDV